MTMRPGRGILLKQFITKVLIVTCGCPDLSTLWWQRNMGLFNCHRDYCMHLL